MLPEGIATVTVTGRALTLDGRALSGQVVFRAPSLITFSDHDVILGGPVTVTLDQTGAYAVTLPATDAPGMSPSGWSYSVTEQFTGVAQNRAYQILLPLESPNVDIADLAPTDPTTPTFVAVRGDSAYEVAVEQGFAGTVEQWLVSLIGPQGVKGDAGPVGSRIHTGTAAPAAALGTDNDLYVQRESTTFLDVASETVTIWQKAAGAWAKQVPDVRGAAWYVNTGPTTSGLTKPGDMLLRTDTGDVWQRDAGGWGAAVGNIKGPKGDAGSTGEQGAPGVVQSVNGKAEAAVVLAAGDVGAVANKGAVTGWVQITSDGTHPLTALAPDGVTMFRVTNAGHPYSNSLRATFYNIGIGPTSVDFGGGQYVVGLKNANVVPTTNPVDGAILYAEGGVLKVRQADGVVFTVGAGGGGGAVASVNGETGTVVLDAADVGASPTGHTHTAAAVGALATTALGAANGVASLDAASRVPIAQLPTVTGRNMWTPQALGFEAWSCDPFGVANPVAKYLTPQRLYMTGFNITENTTVDRIVMFARGYGGVSTNRYRGGIYRENGTKVVESAGIALTMAGQEAGSMPAMVSNHIGAVPLAITQTVLTPGRYWVAWSLVTGGASDFAFFHVQNEAPLATANFWMPGTPFARAWYTEGQTNAALPTTVSQSAAGALADHDIPILALANV